SQLGVDLRARMSAHDIALASVAHCERRDGVALVPFAEKLGTQLIFRRVTHVALSPNPIFMKKGAHSSTFPQYALAASSHAASGLMLADWLSPEQATTTKAGMKRENQRTMSARYLGQIGESNPASLELGHSLEQLLEMQAPN